MKKIIALILALMLALSAACLAENAVAEAPNEEDGQNPVMNLIGDYVDRISQRACMTVACLNNDSADITVSWADSAFQVNVWHMTGVYDTETNTIAYIDCIHTVETYAEDGTGDIELVYENGSGMFTVTGDWIILWEDAQNTEAEGPACEFEFCFEPEDLTLEPSFPAAE